MYENYGDQNFFEYGMLVDTSVTGTEYPILYCMPYSDKEGVYLFADCTVNVEDTWIDRKAVMNFIGMDEGNFEPINFAIGCLSYYGPAIFSPSMPYMKPEMTKEEILKILKYRNIKGGIETIAPAE